MYYARSLLRLGGVTQVMTPSDVGALTHNRLMHTFKVAQVARSMAEVLLARASSHDDISSLGGLDADVVEAAALAHDLGHPPFGHIGERILDKYAREELALTDGFEGNAQSFRILTRLEPRSTTPLGMDVSAATLSAVLKYPWQRPPGDPSEPDALPKFGVYTADADAFARARAWLPTGYAADAQSLEAAIMDLADDITYALHDLEDFRSAGLLSLPAIQRELEAWLEVFADAAAAGEGEAGKGTAGSNRFEALRLKIRNDPAYDTEVFRDAVTAVANHLRGLADPTSPYWRRAQSNSRRFVSSQITQYLGGMTLNPQPTRAEPPVFLASPHWHQIQILKHITREFVISRPDVAAVQRGQQARLWDLLAALGDWLKQDAARVPAELRELVENDEHRGLVDYVASLGDRRAVALHAALRGQGAQTVLTGLSL